MAKKENNFKSGKLARRIEQRREDALNRQDIYNNLSLEKKIQLLNSRRGKSIKEYNRLKKSEKKS